MLPPQRPAVDAPLVPQPSTVAHPFAHYPPGTALQGVLLFYVKRQQSATCGAAVMELHGVRRGPIYRKPALAAVGKSVILATESSCVGVREGEGVIGDVEIRIVDTTGLFVAKLKGKELYIVEERGSLYVASTTRDTATRFALEPRDGRMVPVTLRGHRWYDHAERGWNTAGHGDGLWLEFVSDAGRQAMRRKNPWGHWQPEHDFAWSS